VADMELNLNENVLRNVNSLNDIESKVSILSDAIISLAEAVSILRTITDVETVLMFQNLGSNFPENGLEFRKAVRRYEINLIKQALRTTKGNQTKAARLLRLKVSTLNSIIKRYNISS